MSSAACLVERRDDLARGADALGHLERQRARDVRGGIGVCEVEDVGATSLAKQENVRVAARSSGMPSWRSSR